MKILVVIANFNHNHLLKNLLAKIQKYNILVIDDGSASKLSISKNKNTTNILYNKINRGKGYCIKKAANYAKKYKYTHILTIDADLQHDPSYIDKFILNNSDFDLIYGKRNFLSGMPLLRLFSNYISSIIVSMCCGVRIYDTQCGFRLYKLNMFDNLKSIENGYQFESEILLKKINRSSKITYIDIPVLYNKSKSNINIISDTIKFVKLIIRNIFS